MDQSQIWDETVGSAWVRHADFLAAHTEPFGRAALDRLEPVAGARVIDVGCGTGSTTLALAARGAAEVLGVDLSQPMLDQAERDRAEAGAANVAFRRADVTTVVADPPFDALFSQFGVMFFADAVAAFTGLRTLLRPGGRLAFCAWTDPFANPWMLVPVMASTEALGPPALPGPGEPGPFSLGSPGRAEDVLGAAGWRDVAVETVGFDFAFSGDVATTAAVLVEALPPIALGLVDHPDRVDAVRAAVARDLAPHAGADGTVRLGGEALVVVAQA